MDRSSLVTIIFDFDGTLADTLGMVIDIINSVADKLGFAKISPHDLPILRTLTTRELLKKFSIPLWKVPFIDRKVKKIFRERLDAVTVFEGIPSILSDLKQRGMRLGIVTSNEKSSVQAVLRRYQISDVLDFILSSRSIFGKGRVLKKVLRDQRLDKSRVLYVGDEIRDIEAAREAGIKVGAVSWGYNTREALMSRNPDFLADHPRELVAIIDSIAPQRD